MSDPCFGDGSGAGAVTSDTHCLTHALKIHAKYVDLLEEWYGHRNIMPGGDRALRLYSLVEQVLTTSERYDWGEGDLDKLPSRTDLGAAVSSTPEDTGPGWLDFRAYDSEFDSFDEARLDTVEQLGRALTSDRLQMELRSKPYHERIRATATLLDRLDLWEESKLLLDTLLINDTAFKPAECLDIETQESGDYLNEDGTFDLGMAGSSDAALKAFTGTVDYLKSIATALLAQYVEKGNLAEFLEPIGRVLARFDADLGRGLIQNPTADGLKTVREEFGEQAVENVRNQLGRVTGSALLIADQLLAMIRLVDLYVNQRGPATAKSVLQLGSEAMKVMIGLVEVAQTVTQRVTKEASKKALEQVLRALTGIANLASAVVGFLDAKDAYNQGNYWVMGGYLTAAIATGALALLDAAVVAGLVSSSTAGPIGLLLGLVVLIGALMVILLSDHQIETWFETCVFGDRWASDTDLFTNPDALQFRWRQGGDPHYERQASDLLAMLRGISVRSEFKIGPISHIGAQLQGNVLSRLNIPEALKDRYQYSHLAVEAPSIEANSWLFVKAVTRSGDRWTVTPIYAIDAGAADATQVPEPADFHTLTGRATPTRSDAAVVPDQTSQSQQIEVWLASERLEDVFGVTETAIDDDEVYLEFDLAVLPPGTSLSEAHSFAAGLEDQYVPRKRAFLSRATFLNP